MGIREVTLPVRLRRHPRNFERQKQHNMHSYKHNSVDGGASFFPESRVSGCMLPKVEISREGRGDLRPRELEFYQKVEGVGLREAIFIPQTTDALWNYLVDRVASPRIPEVEAPQRIACSFRNPSLSCVIVLGTERRLF